MIKIKKLLIVSAKNQFNNYITDQILPLYPLGYPLRGVKNVNLK